MPQQKVVKFKDDFYFQCLHSGVFVKKCYALPDFDRYRRRRNGGSFADAACAVAYIENLNQKKKMSDKKYAQLLMSIRQELVPNRPDLELISAPEMTPEEPFFEYRVTYPYMTGEDFFLTVPEVLEWRKEDKERREGKTIYKGPHPYQFRGDKMYELDLDQFPFDMKCLICPFPGGILLEDMDTPKKGRNHKAEEVTGLDRVERDSLVFLFKKFKEEKKKKSESEEDALSSDEDEGGFGERRRGRKRRRCL